MEEKNVIGFKKKEFEIKEYIKGVLEKGKISKVRIEYTPIGEKIIISTHKPGLVIGRKGERIEELTKTIKNRYKLENPTIEIDEIKKPELDAQIIADEIALALEKIGALKFKVIAYKTLQKIMNAKALGVEIVLSGKLPGARAKTWRFSQGFLKKVGNSAKVVERAKSIAQTKPGIIGVKVSILPPDALLSDKINVNEELIEKIKKNIEIKEQGNKSKIRKIKNDDPKNKRH